MAAKGKSVQVETRERLTQELALNQTIKAFNCLELYYFLANRASILEAVHVISPHK